MDLAKAVSVGDVIYFLGVKVLKMPLVGQRHSLPIDYDSDLCALCASKPPWTTKRPWLLQVFRPSRGQKTVGDCCFKIELKVNQARRMCGDQFEMKMDQVLFSHAGIIAKAVGVTKRRLSFQTSVQYMHVKFTCLIPILLILTLR